MCGLRKGRKEKRKKGLFPRLSCFCPFSVLCTRDGGTGAHQMPLWRPGLCLDILPEMEWKTEIL